MKKLQRYSLILVVCFAYCLLPTTSLFSQAPQGLNYQAVARNSSGDILQSRNIGIRFTITNDNGGPVLYRETQNTTTNQFGLFTLIVGKGAPVSGTFSSIDWAAVAPWLQVEMDPAGGNAYVNMGASQLQSVPYSLFAANGNPLLSNGSEAGNTPYWNGSSWIVNDSNVYNNGDNIGINTSSPEGKLHIRGSADASQLVIDADITQSNSNPLIKLRSSDGADLLSIHSDNNTNTFVGLNTGSVNDGQDNTFIGSNAGYSNITGRDNTATGMFSLYSNTNGQDNTATGAYSLAHNTSGNENCAYGYFSLNNNTTGYENTATGVGSLISNTEGSANTASGFSSLYSNTTGYENTSNGFFSLYSNINGIQNTANGVRSLYSNSTGNRNTANGTSSLYSNTTGNENSASGASTLYSNTIGVQNTATGFESLYSNTEGSDNTAYGVFSLGYNTIGNDNTSIGVAALYSNLEGSQNTANGDQSLYSNTFGSNNSANGYISLFSNTTGNDNTATGVNSLYSNTSGNENTANGIRALFSNITGIQNTANGSNSLYYNTIGYNNTATGTGSLYSNTIGDHNTACGVLSLTDNVSGNYNSAFGFFALLGNETGNFNSAFGENAYFNDSQLDNTSCMGYNSGGIVNNSNRIELGNSSISVIAGQVGFSTYSDARIKDNIKEDVPGLAFISKLRPVTYNLNIHRENEMVYKGTKKDEDDWKGKYDIEKIKMSGFLAQDVEKAAKDAGYDFSGVQKPANPDELYSLRYSDFVMPMVKAIQELNDQNKTQQQMIEKQNQIIEDLLNRMEALEKK
ncbi:MAG: tail fiber domain-containing protein [Saprospiraceae bacterium]